MRRATHHPVTRHYDFQDHREMAAGWGEQAIAAIRRAVANPTPGTINDLDYEHAVRAATMAGWHALKVIGKEQKV